MREREKKIVGLIHTTFYNGFLTQEQLIEKKPEITHELKMDFIYNKLRRKLEKTYGIMSQNKLVLIACQLPSKPYKHFILIAAVKSAEEENFCSWTFVIFDSLKESKLYQKTLGDLAEIYDR